MRELQQYFLHRNYVWWNYDGLVYYFHRNEDYYYYFRSVNVFLMDYDGQLLMMKFEMEMYLEEE